MKKFFCQVFRTKYEFRLAATFWICLIHTSSASEWAQQMLEHHDKDKSEALEGEEIPSVLRERMHRVDSNDDQSLDLSELASLPARARSRIWSPDDSASTKSKGRPGAKPGEITTPAARREFTPQTLEVGEMAPDFDLATWQGDRKIRLSSSRGKNPVVLIFGSITCSPFREKVVAVKPLYEQYKDKADFLMVYIREAHPESIIEVEKGGSKELKKFEQTDQYESRQENAAYCDHLLDMPWPMVVDEENNRVKDSYSGWPIRLMVIGKDGKIAFDGGKGPKGFQVDKLAEYLETVKF